MIFTIYCHTNKTNGKRYVGITRRPVAVRWSQHVAAAKMGSKLYFAKAIAKHGKESFEHEVLETTDGIDSANEAEQWWIAHFGSDDHVLGYNLSRGGTAYNSNPESRRKISAYAKLREASMTPQQKTARAMKGLAGLPKEVRHEIAKRREEKKRGGKPPLTRQAPRVKKETRSTNPTPKIEKTKRERPTSDPAARKLRFIEACKAREARKSPEQRSEAIRKGHAKRTAEQRAAAAERLARVNRRVNSDTAQSTFKWT